MTDIPLHSVEAPAGLDIVAGEILHANAVSAANILRDVREYLTNTFGGRMSRYEALINETVERALATLRDKARDAGYDGVIGVRISNPTVVEGGVEVIVYGTGYRLRR